MKDLNYWLQEGPQTEITKKIKDYIKGITGDKFDFVVNTLVRINKDLKMERKHHNWRDIFRNRSADKILEDGFFTGCTDVALVFVTLTRAKGIPTKYIEAIDKKYLDPDYEGPFRGHVFAEVYINDKWHQVNPEMSTLHAVKDYGHYIIFAEALDSWDLGIRSIDDISKVFTGYKNEYISN